MLIRSYAATDPVAREPRHRFSLSTGRQRLKKVLPTGRTWHPMHRRGSRRRRHTAPRHDGAVMPLFSAHLCQLRNGLGSQLDLRRCQHEKSSHEIGGPAEGE